MKFISLFFLLMMPLSVVAEMLCTPSAPVSSIDLGDILVPSHSKAGDIIKMAQIETIVSCDKAAPSYQQLMNIAELMNSSGLTVVVDGVTCPIIDTGFGLENMGIGIVWTNYNSHSGNWSCMSDALTGIHPRKQLMRGGDTLLIDKVYIVRTQAKLKYGEMGVLSQFVTTDEADADRITRGELYTLNMTGRARIAKSACTIESHTTVNMETVSTNNFHGIGSVSSAVPFFLTLTDCDESAEDIKIVLTPTYGYLDENHSVIALHSKKANAKSARGIGIQLTFNNNELTTDGQGKNSGTLTIPIVARYYQMEKEVIPGDVDSSVLFSIYYD